MRYFSYVVARDFGFAPNPFYGVCTLATCKPRIRDSAVIGDWVIGTGSAKYSMEGELVFLMRVTDKKTFNEYWEAPEFRLKRPVMNGSLKKLNGDNIYQAVDNCWLQADSHHSLPGGVTNWDNYNRDTKADAVLISSNFYYFGSRAIEIPKDLRPHVVKKMQGYRCPDIEYGNCLVSLVCGSCEPGYQGEPSSFRKFERYDGK